jgi:hypothetical protein
MRTTLLSAFFLSATLAVISSFSSGVTTSFDATGSPLAGNACRNCHGGNSLGTEATIRLRDGAGFFQTDYIPGEQYSVELSYTTTVAASAFGMQAVILDNANAQAGEMGPPPGRTRIRQRGGIDYIDHSQRLQGDLIAFDWTAPAAGTGEVNIYAVVNAVNGNGSTSGDTPDEAILTLGEMTAPPAPVFPRRDLADLQGVNASSGIPDSLGVLVEVEGLVYGPDSELDMSNFNIFNDDGTAGVAVLNFSDSLNYDATEGQRVVVRGTLSQVVGLTFIEAVEVEVLTSGNTIADEILVTQLDESLEGRFVEMRNVQPVDPTLWQDNPTATYDFPFITPLGDTIIAQIAIGMPIAQMGGVTFGDQGFDISGVVRQFDPEDPFFEGYYLLPRFMTDLREFVSSTKEFNDFDLTVARSGESLSIEAPSAIQALSLVGLDGRILQNYEFGGAQQRITLTTPSSTTPLQVLWVQLSDGRRKAVFVR